MKTFSIRDPILEGITCSEKEKNLINSPLVQRLKWIGQLSMVPQVYNGGNHTRFEHSLGAMVVAGNYMQHLLSSTPKKDWNRNSDIEKHLVQLARVAGLLHDIGHGPFSHSFDHVVYKKIYGIDDGGHDIARLKLVKSDLLAPYLNDLDIHPDELIAVWNPDFDISYPGSSLEEKDHVKNIYSIIRIIVEGPLGADRIDFTRRDAYHTGMQHQGTVPATRIIENSKLVFYPDKSGPFLSYNSKCIEDIIRTLDGRLNLYSSVYLHKTAMAASLLIEKMLDLICEPFNLVSLVSDPETFKRMTDHKILGMISETKFGDDESFNKKLSEAKKLYEQLMDRKLPKMDFEARVFDMTKTYNEQEYREKYYSNRKEKNYEIVKTRVISGISSDKFDKYGIVFHDETKLLKCSECFDKVGYTIPIQPYYIVRGYTL